MKRNMIRSASISLLAVLMLSILAACGASGSSSGSSTTTINLFADGDVNVQSLWQNTLIPQFEKAYPSIKVHMTFSEHGTSDTTTFARISAAVAQKKNPGFDLMDSDMVPEGATANILMPVTTQQVPALAHVDSALLTPVNNEALPYRASSVVLAYNSKYVKNPPTTLSGLIAWIKANPGKFTYNTPDSGGSGQSFVQSVINASVPASDQSKFVSGTYNTALESDWTPGLNVLKSLKPSIYRNGYYPDGNTAVLQLLNNSSIWMAPVWSDQSLSALADKTLPSTVKLEQITPALDGGPAYLGIPKGAPHAQQAYTLMNWVLNPTVQTEVVNAMDGYPGIEWQYMPSSTQSKFASIAKSYNLDYSAKFLADVNKNWQNQVAGG